MIYFTADWHLFHHNIIQYCKRPFKNVDEMNATLIHNYNAIVKQDDICYFLGDTCFSLDQLNELIPQLNGKKFFLEGNHDKWWNSRHEVKDKNVLFLPKEFMLASKRSNNLAVVLNHYPMRSWDSAHYGTYHLYGHVHGQLPDYGLSTDVGVDNTMYYPVSLEGIVNKFNLIGKNHIPYSIFERRYNVQ